MNVLKTWLADRLCCPNSEACESTGPRGAWWTLGMSVTAFLLCGQAITGFVLWAYYSPSAQTAWESVYFIQYEVPLGWLVRGIHYWAAQVLVGWLGLYVTWLIIRGLVRAPREFVYWTALFLGLFALGACLTGDLLAWDQEAYAATKTRVSFLNLLPEVGDELFRIAAGGPQMGSATLTRFFALHVAVFAGGLIALFLLHAWTSRLAAVPRTAYPETRRRKGFHPVLHGAACIVTCAVVLGFVFAPAAKDKSVLEQPAMHLGADLGSPADRNPANFYAGARPEWSFRGLYGFSNAFPGELKILPIFVIPSIVMVLFLLMPFVGRLDLVGYLFNLAVYLVVLVGLAYYSYVAWSHDWHDEDYYASVAAEEAQAERIVELIQGRQGIAPDGALAMLKRDPKLQGPKLYDQQCVSCHNWTPEDESQAMTSDNPSAPDLYGFGTRAWIEKLFDPEHIASDRYFGNTKFATGMMVRYVQDKFGDVPEEDQDAIIEALVAEAGLSKEPLDETLVARGRELIAGPECARCHRYRGNGPVGAAPDLTGYGSREWLLGMIADPAHSAFYSARNDRMPVYVEDPAAPEKNRLSVGQVAVLADWLRGDWYEPAEQEATEETPSSSVKPALLALGEWEGRKVEVPPMPEAPEEQGRWLFETAGCAVCHPHTGTADGDIMPAHPVAPDLGGFATEDWIRGFLDRKQIDGPKYFGNTAFAEGDMVDFVQGSLRELIDDIGDDVFDELIAALAAEAKKGPNPEPPDEDTMYLFEDFTCIDCHKFYEEGDGGPDLTGYGSVAWLKGIIADPTHSRYYGNSNDAMPSYAGSEDPAKNMLTDEQIDILAKWLLKPALAK
ncbi:hypothetical protein JCM19992_12560 [Thermostilla marina]